MKGNVTCSCGHSWSKSKSSKEDMNVCHICGKDNTMKNGGWLDKYQEGGNVAVSDATRTKFTKNTGLKKGVDQPISDMLDITLGAPQRQLVKMITGKEQSPSEAMGIENPYGVFAADAILDPTNLVGAGLLAKSAKAITKTGVLSKAYKINPWAFKPNPEAYYRMLGEEGVTDALIQRKLRPAQNSNNWTMSTVKNRADKVWFNKGYPMTTEYNPNLVLGYKGPGMAEYSGKLIESPGGGSHLWDRTYGYAENNIPLSDPNVKLLKEHWLKGYKEVPKKENGGWLEKYNDGGPVQPNYNDYSVSAPEGFEGDGYSNVGRNYSPAWGGQFKEGGKVKPIVVNDKKDPRLKAYNDSLKVYNKVDRQTLKDWKNNSGNEYGWMNYHNMNHPDLKGKFAYPPNAYGDKYGIKPIGAVSNRGSEAYTPIYKKPTQPVIYQKLEPTPQSTIDFIEGNYAQEPIIEIPQPQSQVSPYGEVVDPRTGYTHMTRQGSAMYPLVGQRVPEMEDGGPIKRFMQPTETFKNYGYNPKENGMSTELSTSIGGPGEVYLVPGYRQGKILQNPEGVFNAYGEHLGGPFKTVKAAEDFAKLRHKYVEKNQNIPAPIKTRDYAMGGSMPGAVGNMYTRLGAPSEGKYAKKTEASAQNGTEMRYYQEGLDFKPKSISKNGSVIKDDRGQWDHPGEITEIGSNQITMQGVPYPVMGVSDTGDTQMMYPNQEYQYNGNSVTEYPMMQDGGVLDSIINLGKRAVNYVGGLFDDDDKTTTAPVTKTPINSESDMYDKFLDLGFNNPKSKKLKQQLEFENEFDYSKDKNKIKLGTGRFKNANVSSRLIDDIAAAAKRNNIPIGQLLTLAGRESTFGEEKGNSRHGLGNSAYTSAYNVAEDYQPYAPHRFLADKKVPGINVIKDPGGYQYEVADEKAAREYLKKNPKLMEQYKKKIESTPDIGNRNYFDLSAEFLKKKGVQGYNPRDPKYVEMFNKDYDTLKQDKALMSYLKKKGYKYEEGGQLTKLDQLTNFTNYNTKQPGGWLDKYQ